MYVVYNYIYIDYCLLSVTYMYVFLNTYIYNQILKVIDLIIS